MDYFFYVCLSFVSALCFHRMKIAEKECEQLREELELYKFFLDKKRVREKFLREE